MLQIAITDYKDASKPHSHAELLALANRIKPDIEFYSGRQSKWNGSLVLKNDNNAGGKNWDCSIRLNPSVPEHVLIHEMIHSCSASHFGRAVWLNHPWEEELTVHYLSQELAAVQGFAVVDSGYDSGVDLIRNFKAAVGIATSDLEFASELLKQPLGERWDWLATQIFNARNFDMTVERYQELADKLEAIRRWTPQK